MALAGGFGAIAKNMPQMSAAIRAVDFGARVADFIIGAGAYRPIVDRLEKARPAGAAVIFMRRRIEPVATASADIGSGSLFLV